jgi:hypothetical protein
MVVIFFITPAPQPTGLRKAAKLRRQEAHPTQYAGGTVVDHWHARKPEYFSLFDRENPQTKF